MVETDKIYNMDCFELMSMMDDGCVDVVLTSPFYNTNKKQGNGRTLTNTHVKKPTDYPSTRYDTHVDNLTDDEYCDFTVRLFNEFDRILKPNGSILYNICYGSENTEGMFLAVADILRNTAFTVSDCITWKKRSAMPNSTSSNKLTRIVEYVFVFCRRSESNTFHCNKRITSYRKTGQAAYENIFNFIEADNNDEPCPYNKATYSTELCEKLLRLYAPKEAVVYDPFMGSGTTARACKNLFLHYIGSEISENQVKWANERLEKERPLDIIQQSLFDV